MTNLTKHEIIANRLARTMANVLCANNYNISSAIHLPVYRIQRLLVDYNRYNRMDAACPKIMGKRFVIAQWYACILHMLRRLHLPDEAFNESVNVLLVYPMMSLPMRNKYSKLIEFKRYIKSTNASTRTLYDTLSAFYEYKKDTSSGFMPSKPLIDDCCDLFGICKDFRSAFIPKNNIQEWGLFNEYSKTIARDYLQKVTLTDAVTNYFMFAANQE